MNSIHYTHSEKELLFGLILGFFLGIFLSIAIMYNTDAIPSVVQAQLDQAHNTCEKLGTTLKGYDQSEVTCENGVTLKNYEKGHE